MLLHGCGVSSDPAEVRHLLLTPERPGDLLQHLRHPKFPFRLIICEGNREVLYECQDLVPATGQRDFSVSTASSGFVYPSTPEPE